VLARQGGDDEASGSIRSQDTDSGVSSLSSPVEGLFATRSIPQRLEQSSTSEEVSEVGGDASRVKARALRWREVFDLSGGAKYHVAFTPSLRYTVLEEVLQQAPMKTLGDVERVWGPPTEFLGSAPAKTKTRKTFEGELCGDDEMCEAASDVEAGDRWDVHAGGHDATWMHSSGRSGGARGVKEWWRCVVLPCHLFPALCSWFLTSLPTRRRRLVPSLLEDDLLASSRLLASSPCKNSC
jgi:hypothetical protein